jgi:ABC-type multidrug transport system ATPase subunit
VSISFQHPAVLDDLSVLENLRVALPPHVFATGNPEETARAMLEDVGLHVALHLRADSLTVAQKHLLEIAKALATRPPVLILDEPTDGLDPNQKDVVRNLIKEMGKTKAIIFSTHILEEVEACCTRAVIIDQGKVVADGTPDELKRRALRAGSVHVKITGPGAASLAGDLARLGHAGRIEDPVTADDSFQGTVYPKAKTATGALTTEIYDLCRNRNLTLSELHEEPGRLDDMFRELTSQNQV